MGFFNKFKKSEQRSEGLEQTLGQLKKGGKRNIIVSDVVVELGNKIIATIETPTTFGEMLSTAYNIIISEGHKCGEPSSVQFEGSMRALLWRLWGIIEGAGKAGEHESTKVCAAIYGILIHAIYKLAMKNAATLDIASLWVSSDQRSFHEKATKAYAIPTADKNAIGEVIRALPSRWTGQ